MISNLNLILRLWENLQQGILYQDSSEKQNQQNIINIHYAYNMYTYHLCSFTYICVCKHQRERKRERKGKGKIVFKKLVHTIVGVWHIQNLQGGLVTRELILPLNQRIHCGKRIGFDSLTGLSKTSIEMKAII